MTRWEYMLLEQSSASGKFIVDQYGREGWEMVSVVRATETIDRIWFKREVRRPGRPPGPKSTRKDNQ
jgi:hypothetical protein